MGDLEDKSNGTDIPRLQVYDFGRPSPDPLWQHDKIPRLNSMSVRERDNHQPLGVTMKKTRVSVRTRYECTVYIIFINLSHHKVHGCV